MGFKNAWKFEKENMPDFQWRYEKFLLAYLIVLGGGVMLSMTIGLILDNVFHVADLICMIPYFVFLVPFIGMTVTLVIKGNKVKKNLLAYHLQKVNEKFYDIDYMQAVQALSEQKKVTEVGFALDNFSPFESIDIIPFDRAKVAFVPQFWGGKLFLNFLVMDHDTYMFNDEMDNNYYNLLKNNMQMFADKRLFDLFCNDRETFIRLLIRYNTNYDIIFKKL